jgi:hypothetical protein
MNSRSGGLVAPHVFSWLAEKGVPATDELSAITDRKAGYDWLLLGEG